MTKEQFDAKLDAALAEAKAKKETAHMGYCQAMDSSLPDGICTAPADGTHEGADGVVRPLCARHLQTIR